MTAPQQQPKKPMSTRMGLLWMLGGFLVLVVVASMLNGTSAGDKLAGKPTAVSQVAAAASAPDPTMTPAPRLASVGDALQTSNWRIAVSSVDRPGKALKISQFTQYDAVGTYLIVNLSLTNIGKANFTVNSHDFELKDRAGVTYNTASCCYSYAESKKLVEIGKQLPPSVDVKSALIFDIAPAAEGLTLTFKQDGGRTWSIE